MKTLLSPGNIVRFVQSFEDLVVIGKHQPSPRWKGWECEPLEKIENALEGLQDRIWGSVKDLVAHVCVLCSSLGYVIIAGRGIARV